MKAARFRLRASENPQGNQGRQLCWRPGIIESAGEPVATVMRALARTGINWSGTSLELYERVSKLPGRKDGPRWPKTDSMFGDELRRIAPQLSLHTLSINFLKGHGARES